jgi:copper chaperone
MSTKTYEVPAISCGHCTATIERELKFVEGVERVEAELETKRVTKELIIPIVGMHCANCANTVGRSLKRLPGCG